MYYRIALWLLAVALLLAPVPATWVEAAYSRGLYRLVQPPLATLANVVPFAMFDVALGLSAILTLVFVLRIIFRPRTQGLRSLSQLATMWSMIVVVFAITWGANFRRVPLREASNFDAARVTPATVRALAERTVRELNESRAEISGDWPDDATMRDSLARYFGEAAEAVVGWQPALSRPKATLLQWYMPRIARNGQYLSLFHEIALNPELLPFERPYVLAHEWAHGLGHASESEAAYVAWLACDRGPAWARYSAWLRVLDYLIDDLAPGELREVLAPLDSAVIDDRRARRERTHRHLSPHLGRVHTVVQNTTAAIGRVEPSQRDYGLVVQLIIGLDDSHRSHPRINAESADHP